MFQDFMTWLAIGAGSRASAGWLLTTFTEHRLRVPQQLAGAVITASFLLKITFLLPIPLGLAVGLVLQDAILERR